LSKSLTNRKEVMGMLSEELEKNLHLVRTTMVIDQKE
jgi:hypothetical protein